MANQFLHIEDNEDGTCTITMKVKDEEEFSFLVQADFNNLGSLIPVEAVRETTEKLLGTAIEIPNQPPKEA